MKHIFLVLLCGFMLMTGCSKTTVVLLPKQDDGVGEIFVSSDTATQTLNQANEFTQVSSKNSAPSEPEIMTQQQVDSQFKDTLNALPQNPVSFILYFTFGTEDLIPESVVLISRVITTVKDRIPCEISVIGHTDTMGNAAYNFNLSLKRATVVKNLLIQKGISPTIMDVTSYGENDPLVKTADNVNEPKNRRVEVMIR